MDKDRKIKRKAFDGPYLEFYYETKRYIRELNLNKICYDKALCEAIDQIYESYKNKVPAKQALGKEPRKTIEKITKGMPKKTMLQSVVDTIFLFAASMAFLIPVIYLINFTSSNSFAHNDGVVMYFEANKLFQVIMFAVVITVVMMIVNKVMMKDSYPRSSMITSSIFAIVFAILGIIINNFKADTVISINFLIVEGIIVAISLLGYFGGIFLYGRTYKSYYEKK